MTNNKEAVPRAASLQRRPSSGDELRPLVATDVERGGIVTVADIDAEGCWLPASKNTADETLPNGVAQDRESRRQDAQDPSHARAFVRRGVEGCKQELEDEWIPKLGFSALVFALLACASVVAIAESTAAVVVAVVLVGCCCGLVAPGFALSDRKKRREWNAQIVVPAVGFFLVAALLVVPSGLMATSSGASRGC